MTPIEEFLEELNGIEIAFRQGKIDKNECNRQMDKLREDYNAAREKGFEPDVDDCLKGKSEDEDLNGYETGQIVDYDDCY